MYYCCRAIPAGLTGEEFCLISDENRNISEDIGTSTPANRCSICPLIMMMLLNMQEKVFVKPMVDWVKKITGKIPEKESRFNDSRQSAMFDEPDIQDEAAPDIGEISYTNSDAHMVNYAPEDILKSVNGVGNPEIREELEAMIPVSLYISMPELLDVFKQYPQHTYFPVIDEWNRPRGIIREQRLKKFVYSRFGSTLLENPNLKDKLADFIEPCTTVDIEDKSEHVLKTYSESGTTEAIIVTVDSRYLGIISLRSLVKLGHKRELNLRESHNRILQQRNNDINNILRSMKQGIFTILEDGTIHHDYSVYLENILETNQIRGRTYHDLLFSNSDISKDKLSQVRSTVENSLGEDILTFEVNSHLLIEDYRIVSDDGAARHIELFWNPIVDEDDIVRRFVVNIRDKTEIVTLQEKTLQQQKEFKIISQVFSISHENFESFLSASGQDLQTCLQLLEKNSRLKMEVIDHVFRNLHTIKGNSRLYGFDDLTNVVHEVEEVVNRVRSREIPYHNQELILEISRVERALGEYSMVISNKLSGFLENRERGVFLDDQLFSILRNTIMNESCDELTDLIQTIIKSQKILQIHDTIPLQSVFNDITGSIQPMADVVGKLKPDIHFESGGIRVTRELASVLNVSIMHSIRNSLSHGIEDEEERIRKGKSKQGSIHLEPGIMDQWFLLEYWDDGAGLDLVKVMKKARDLGLVKIDKPLGARQIAQFVFHPGLSTAGNVTEIAGRGVGMDAILKAIKGVGGSIDIVFRKLSDENPLRRPFKFIFRFPVENAQVLE